MVALQIFFWHGLYPAKEGRYATYRVNAIDDSDDVAAFDDYGLYFHHATQKLLHKQFARIHAIMDLRQKFASTTIELPSDYQNQ